MIFLDHLEQEGIFIVKNKEEKELVYNTKWDKCGWLSRIGHFGNGNQDKACIEDVYNQRYNYCGLKDLELVIKSNPDVSI